MTAVFHPQNYQQRFSGLASGIGGCRLSGRSPIFGSAGHGWPPWPDWAWDVDAACSIRGSWLPALALSSWYPREDFGSRAGNGSESLW